jgi:hypothetical protein
MVFRSPLPALVLGLLGCGSHPATTPEPPPPTNDKLTLRPVLHVGDKLVFHVEASIDASVNAQHAKASLRLDDQVEIVSAAQVKETFSNVKADGDGEVADALKRVAVALPTAAVTTSFDPNWQVASSTIDGTQDDEARTMIMNLTPVVSFRMLPKDPVAIGDSWKNEWTEALRSEQGKGAGKVATNVRYALKAVAACGGRRCATITGDGEDTIPPQNGMTGTSTFHGEQQVDVADMVPVSKLIESKTSMHGEQQGQPFDVTNVVTVRVQRGDK